MFQWSRKTCDMLRFAAKFAQRPDWPCTNWDLRLRSIRSLWVCSLCSLAPVHSFSMFLWEIGNQRVHDADFDCQLADQQFDLHGFVWSLGLPRQAGSGEGPFGLAGSHCGKAGILSAFASGHEAIFQWSIFRQSAVPTQNGLGGGLPKWRLYCHCIPVLFPRHGSWGCWSCLSTDS